MDVSCFDSATNGVETTTRVSAEVRKMLCSLTCTLRLSSLIWVNGSVCDWKSGVDGSDSFLHCVVFRHRVH